MKKHFIIFLKILSITYNKKRRVIFFTYLNEKIKKINRSIRQKIKKPNITKPAVVENIVKNSEVLVKKLFSLSINIIRRLKINLIEIIHYVRKKLNLYYCKILHKKVAVSVSKFRQLSCAEQDEIIAKLSKKNYQNQKIKISIIGTTRRFLYENNSLKRLLYSVKKTTGNFSQIELIFRIDDDDDLLYYYALHEKYADVLNLSFVIGKRYNGYESIHFLLSEGCRAMSSYASTMLFVTDDTIFLQKHWDIELQNAISKFHRDIFFINPHIHNPNILPWDDTKRMLEILSCEGGPSACIFGLSKKTYLAMSKVAMNYEHWTAFGNTLKIDGFFELLRMYLWRLEHRENTLIFPEMIKLPRPLNPKSSALISKVERIFADEKTQSIIQEMASELFHQSSVAK